MVKWFFYTQKKETRLLADTGNEQIPYNIAFLHPSLNIERELSLESSNPIATNSQEVLDNQFLHIDSDICEQLTTDVIPINGDDPDNITVNIQETSRHNETLYKDTQSIIRGYTMVIYHWCKECCCRCFTHQYLYYFGLILFYFIHLICQILQLSSSVEVFISIVCIIVSFTGLLHGICKAMPRWLLYIVKEMYFTVYSKVNNLVLKDKRNGYSLHSSNKEIEVQTILHQKFKFVKYYLMELLIYPSIICSLFGFIYDGSAIYSIPLLIYSIVMYVIYVTIYDLLEVIRTVRYMSRFHVLERRLCKVPLRIIINHIILDLVHWTMLAIIGVRLHADNEVKNSSELTSDLTETKVGHNYQSALLTYIMIVYGVIVHFAMYKNRVQFTSVHLYETSKGAVRIQCPSFKDFIRYPIIHNNIPINYYFGVIFLMVPFIPVAIGSFLVDYNSSVLSSNTRSAAQGLGVCFVISFLISNIQAVLIFVIVVINVLLLTIGAILALPTLSHWLQSYKSDNDNEEFSYDEVPSKDKSKMNVAIRFRGSVFIKKLKDTVFRYEKFPKYLYTVGLFTFYLAHFISQIVIFTREDEHPAYNIICIIISTTSLLHGFCKGIIHSLCMCHSIENQNKLLKDEETHNDERGVKQKVVYGPYSGKHLYKILLADKIWELLIYPSIICSLYGFVNGKGWEFDGTVATIHFVLLIYSIIMDIIYVKIIYIWILQRVVRIAYYKNAVLKKTSCFTGYLSRVSVSIIYGIVSSLVHWLMIAIIGVRVYVDNEENHISNNSVPINISDTNYKSSAYTYTYYMIFCGAYLPITTAIVYILLNRNWFHKIFKFKLPPSLFIFRKLPLTCVHVSTHPLPYFAVIFLMVPFIAFAVGSFLVDYNSSVLPSNTKSAAQGLGVCFVILFLISNIQAVIGFVITVIKLLLLAIGTILALPTLFHYPLNNSASNDTLDNGESDSI